MSIFRLVTAFGELHKALAYVATFSRALTEHYTPSVSSTLVKLDNPFPRKVLDNNWVKPNKRIFNNAKVGDHFAIIPTGTVPSRAAGLDSNEQAVFDMLTNRFVAVFFPPAQYENTTRITRVEAEPFKTEGKIMVAPGWLEVYGREITGDKPEENLPAVQRGEGVETVRVEINTEQSRPPVRYNEGTVLSAMEGAGKLVDDEELRDAMKEKGLGTQATRAAIIEA